MNLAMSSVSDIMKYALIYLCFNFVVSKISVLSRVSHPLKIINGETADIRDFPYVVSLQYNGSFYGHDYDHFCCGSIVNEYWIVTSAQCAQARETYDFHVRVGSSEYYKNGVIYKIEKIIIHPDFNEIQRDYDVALIKVSKKIIFNKYVKPIKLPKNSDTIRERTNLSIVGWGASQILGTMSDKLLRSHIQKINDQKCQFVYGTNIITDRMFCVFSKGFGPCVGDSGSPAVHKNKLIGIASWSYGCAYENPSVYVKISSVINWIKDCIRNDKDATKKLKRRS